MGTSNWQQIPFCIDALMKIAPTRVLDVGVGFGRWGMITREFCDVWYSRIFKDQWAVHVEGIEAFAKNITDYHNAFYNTIHIGDAAALIPSLPGPWSVTIYGDVLEHFTKEQAGELLNTSLDRSDYVIVNIPIGEDYPQDDLYGNVYERHLSTWRPEDFDAFSLVRRLILADFQDRAYGSFILSRADPRRLRASLFSKTARYADFSPEVKLNDDLGAALRRVQEQSFELGFIKRSESYRLARRLRRGKVARARALLGGRSGSLTVRVPGEQSAGSNGTEVWVISVRSAPEQHPIPWDFMEFTGHWGEKPSGPSAYGTCHHCVRGSLRVRPGADPEVVLLTHPWGGIAEVEFAGRRERVDTFSPGPGTIVVRPARSPMVESSPGAGAAGAAHAVVPAVSVTPPDVEAAAGWLSPGEQRFVDTFRAAKAADPAAAIAIHCPRWLGVTSSTRHLFDHCYAVPSTPAEDPFAVTDAQLDRHAAVLAAGGTDHLVCSGGDEIHLRLADKLRALRPGLVVDLLWHGSYVQVSEDYAWHILKLWIEGVKSGRVRSIATVKAGMDEYFRALGVPSAFLMNVVPGEPLTPPEIPGEELRVGIWMSSPTPRKWPYAMLAALPMLQPVRLYAAGVDDRARELIDLQNTRVGLLDRRPVPPDRLREAIRRTHLTMYVTFSECCPMLPLESLALGVPCLVGPVSHLFEDNAFLHERLVVPSPDRADVIARYARRAADERHEIAAEYARWAPSYIAAARRGVAEFLAHGPAPLAEFELPART